MPLVQKANNKLFKWFGANVWTKNIRTVAVAIAKDTLVHYAETNNLKALKQLGMGDDAVARVLEWSSKNDWYDRASQGGGYSDVATALNEWVDTAIVRPNSALRTAWGNDHRMAMMWYLHDFLWGFQAKILDRVIHQARMSKGIPAQAMPFLMLGAFLLPWSALGYELRWMLTQPGAAALTGGTVQTPHKQGFDYFSDVVNRSGMLGIFGLVQESYEAVERNDNPFVPLLGAPIDKTLDWLTKDTEYMMAHTLPPMSLSSVVRKEVRGTDAWQWLFDKGQYADD
jgi:hypothetical protein